MNLRKVSFLFAGLTLLCGTSAMSWHQEAVLQSVVTSSVVRFDNIGAPAPAVAPPGAGKFTLLDLNLGHLWNANVVAFRLPDGRFLSFAGNGPVQAEPLRLTAEIDSNSPAQGGRVMAPEHKLRIVVREAAGTCPLAATPDTSSPLTPPPLIPTALINDGCTVGFVSEDGLRELIVNPAGVLSMRVVPASVSSADDNRFRINLRGLPPANTLSAPFLEANEFIRFVVHVDHRSPSGDRGLRCEDSRGRSQFVRNGRNCYPGHEGTDFIVRPLYKPGMVTPPIRAVAAAPGLVVGIADGNFDRCYFNPPANCTVTPSTRTVRCPAIGDYQGYITCNGGPSGTPSRDVNKVMVAQDDGLIAEYVHLKNGTLAVRLGERVECGQVLGLVGSSGTSALPHLHFDLSKPPLPIDFNQAPDEGKGSRLAKVTSRMDLDPLRAGANQGTPELVDPYDFRDANGRPTMWTDLPGNGQNALPLLTCKHPSQAQSEVQGGITDGGPCQRNNQCRPGRTCSSDGICEARRQPGGACLADNDCAAFSACENQVCTRRGLAPGMRCGSGLICGPALDCVHDRCTVAQPPPPPECPPGLSKKCPDAGCKVINGECRKKLHPSQSCSLICLP